MNAPLAGGAEKEIIIPNSRNARDRRETESSEKESTLFDRPGSN